MRRRPEAHDLRGVTKLGGQHVARCSCAWTGKANRDEAARKLWEIHAVAARRADRIRK